MSYTHRRTTTNCGAAQGNHVFAHLASPPYRFIGHTTETYQACQGAPVQPGASCDYCGTGISQVFRFRGSDGRTFKVGSDCVRKAGDEGLRKVVDKIVAAQRAEARRLRENAIVEQGRALVDDPAVRAILATLPHSRGFSGLTRLNEAEWMFRLAGHAGRVRESRALITLAAGRRKVTA